MTAQVDLFGEAGALPSGLSYRDEMLSDADETSLIAQLADVAVAPFRFQGWTGKRETASFGWHYDFDNSRFAETAPIPNFLLPLRERAADFAGLAAEDLVQALVIRYGVGAGIGWHRDRPVFEHVVGVSLAAPATLRLRRRNGRSFERAAVPLRRRSAYHLSGAARHEWEHSIVPTDALRWSITFRSLSSRGGPL